MGQVIDTRHDDEYVVHAVYNVLLYRALAKRPVLRQVELYRS